ncbi:MAG: SUMF1/EgtB/PvdO family nonheme iron enzyme [Desulfobacteraceae bacterium]|nr:SUMF1/EgtB/PvdO family nonheme iron enzyme [Desulfobacteraceae bacterium]
MKKLNLLLIIFIFFMGLFVSEVYAGRYHALLIGVDNYSDSMLKGPGTAVNDAKGLASVLGEKFGFEIEILTAEKAAGRDIINKIESYSKILSKEDTLFIFFSGKTETDPLYGHAWWIPYDAFYGDTLTYIDYTKASGILKNIKADTFIATNSALPKDYSSWSVDKEKTGAGNGIKLILSSSGDQSVSSVDPKYSVFGFALIQALKSADKKEVFISSICELTKKNASSQGLIPEFKVLGLSPVKQGDIKLSNLHVKKEAKEESTEKKIQKEPEKKEAFLTVTSEPGNSELFINTKLIGKTPVEKLILKPGTHNIELLRRGYKDKKLSITLSQDEEKTLDLTLEKLPPKKGSLIVNLNPENGIIKFKNKNIEFSNKTMLEPGKYELLLSAPFYLSRTIAVEIPEGENITITEKLLPVDKFTNSVSQNFVRIKKGEFIMGSPDQEFRRDPDESQHKVFISKDFFIMTKEVTVGDWKQFTSETGYKTEAENNGGALVWIGYKWDKSWKYNWKNPGFDQNDNEPVTCITYNDALNYCEWLSQKEGLKYKLPTEAQWEYSCRAGTETEFAYGQCLLDNQANFAANSRRGDCPEGKNRNRTIETGILEPNQWGLFDIHGNVLEWCSDFYAPYDISDSTDPNGPVTGETKVVRGCSWETDINNCRSGNRFSESMNSAKNNTGFRLVLIP